MYSNDEREEYRRESARRSEGANRQWVMAGNVEPRATLDYAWEREYSLHLAARVLAEHRNPDRTELRDAKEARRAAARAHRAA